MNIQTTAILFSSVTMLCWGIENAVSKKYAERINSSTLMLYRQFFALPIVLIALLLFKNTITVNFTYILLGFGIAFISYFGYLFLLQGFKRGAVGVVSPISSVKILFSVLIGSLFLGDVLTPLEIACILVIFLGIALLSLDFKSFKISTMFQKEKGILFAFLSAVAWGVASPFYSVPSAILGAFLFTLILESATFFISLFRQVLINKKDRVSKEQFRNNVGGLVAMGAFGGVGSVFLNLGYATKEVGTVSVISGSAPLVAMLYSRIFYKEKLTVTQYIAAIMIMLGVLSLAYLSNYA